MTYQREILIWPVGKETQALAYCDVADAAYAEYTGIPSDVFCHRDRFDRHGQQVTAFYGPTGHGTEENPGPAEPPQCFAARSDAVLATTVDWPSEE